MEKFKFLSKNKTPYQKLRFGTGPVQYRASLRYWVSQLPKSPGVYVFSARGGKNKSYLYIGKAANIKDRVKNHFQQPAYRDNLFLDKIKKVGFLKTDSEIEALLLEAKLIKKYQPKFNVIWRDDKNYFFIGITKEEFPRIFITHQPKTESRILNIESRRKNSKFKIQNSKFNYLGPFVDGKALKQTLRILRKVFPYRSCKNLPKRPCLWYQLDRCPAPCLSKSNLGAQPFTFRERPPQNKQPKYDSTLGFYRKVKGQLSSWRIKMKKECQRNAKNFLKVLKGEKKQVLKDLKKEMEKAAKEENFETAAEIRNQIFSLERILAHSKILDSGFTHPKWTEIEKTLKKILETKHKISRIEAYDISNIQGKLATGSMVTFIKGNPDKSFYRKFRLKIAGKPNDVAMLKEILKRRFLHSEWSYPDLILIDGGKAQLNAAKSTVKENKLKIPVAAIAKKKNELYLENRKKPLLLKKLSREIFNLILQLRDEAHRFALTYHKKLRKKHLIK